MYIVIFCSLLCLLFTYFESVGKMKNGMKWGFILVTFLAVIHYDYGSDYMAYYRSYNEITSYPFNLKAIFQGDYFRDPGWAMLFFLFKPIGGFFMLVAVLNVIQNVLIYRFVKNNCPKEWWAFGVFIYLCVTSNYLMAFSMMRQSFVLAVFLGIWPWIKERKWWYALPIILLCTQIHGSSKLLIPFAFWGFVPTKQTKLTAIFYGVLFCLLLASGTLLNNIFEQIMTIEDFAEYADTYSNDKNTAKYGLGFIILLLPFIFSLYYLLKSEAEENNRSMVMLASIASLIIPFGQIIPLVGRVGLYFSYYQIAAYPIVYMSLCKKNKTIGRFATCIFALITMYDYWLFFHSEIFAKPYSTFHTIFEVL